MEKISAMKSFLFIGALLLSSIGFSQEAPKRFEKKETIITIKDSVPYYLEQYKERTQAVNMSNCWMMRVSYVYLNGEKMSVEKINTLRNKIIADYKKGIPFADLANKHTMDTSKDGDLKWFSTGTMEAVFEDEIRKHKKGDIFTVDIPEKNWYYVVLKTYDDIRKLKVEITLKD